jgi:hypothetical protein
MIELINNLQESLQLLSSAIGKITIGNKKQFPLGWRNAAKGRTVWRIIEEIVIQNLQVDAINFNLSNVDFADSEVAVYDFKCQIKGSPIYVNIKSSLLEGSSNKDDISKPQGLKTFFEDDMSRNLFIATFFIKFNEGEEMSVEIDSVKIFPIVWLSDIYINPSNNGNLQSSKYKEITDATQRTNDEFLKLLTAEMKVAEKKKKAKRKSKKK